MTGTTVPVKISGPAPCRTCHGSGAAPGTSPITCPECGGSGQIAVNQGPFQMSQTCPRCRGNGRIVETPCPTCHGSGAERRTRRLQVKIPAGVKDGARIKLTGRGEPGPPGGEARRPLRPRERREGPHLSAARATTSRWTCPSPISEAALGANVQVPTLNGPVTLKVPAGTPSGKTFRVKGRGAPRKNGHGDLLATVRVDVPGKLSREEKQLLQQLQEARPESPRAKLGVT